MSKHPEFCTTVCLDRYSVPLYVSLTLTPSVSYQLTAACSVMVCWYSAGRVLNRFSKDIGFLDDLLPFSFVQYIVVSSTCDYLDLVMQCTH